MIGGSHLSSLLPLPFVVAVRDLPLLVIAFMLISADLASSDFTTKSQPELVLGQHLVQARLAPIVSPFDKTSEACS